MSPTSVPSTSRARPHRPGRRSAHPPADSDTTLAKPGDAPPLGSECSGCQATVALIDQVGRDTDPMTSSSASAFAGFRFPREVISVAVRWYLRYGLSYRDVEELLAERGVDVDHVSIYRWVQRFTPEFIEAARTCRHVPGDRWFVDICRAPAHDDMSVLLR